MELESTIPTLPTRPKGDYYDKFRTINITSNHFKVQIKNLDFVFLYKIDFEPKLEESDRLTRNDIFQRCHITISKEIHQPIISGNIIYTTKKPQWEEDKRKIDLDYKNIKLVMCVRLVKTIDFKNQPENKNMEITFLNNYLRSTFKRLGFVEIGKTKKFFDKSTKRKISNSDLILFEGTAANFCRLQGGLFLKIDSASKLVRAITVLDLINDIIGQNKHKQKQERRQIVRSALQHSTVMANYGASNYWRVDNVIFDQNVKITRIGEEGQTLKDYYETRYNQKIDCQKQPILEATDKLKRKVLLIPELCLPVGLPLDASVQIRKDISKATNDHANARVDKIKRIRELFNSELMKNGFVSLEQGLGIKIQDNLTSSKAKVIPITPLLIGDREKISSSSSFTLFSKPLYDTSKEISCYLINCGENDPSPIIDLFKTTSRSLRLSLTLKAVRVSSSQSANLLEKIKQEIQHQAKKGIYNVFFIILPQRNCDSLYKHIKKLCYTQYKNILMQVAKDKPQKSGFASTVTKILLQIAAKVGNILWKPVCQVTEKHRILLIGVNSCPQKSGPGKRVGFCSTVNKDLTLFYADTWIQKSNNPLIEDMGTVISGSVKQYLLKNNCPPTQIILLKDGCASGQVKSIQMVEVQSCVESIKKLSKEIKFSLKFTFVIIDKKPTQKFFYNPDSKLENPKSGTTINSDVVSPDYQFFLISQSSKQSTTTPILYKIIHCDSDLEAGQLQDVLYSQCFNYANWTGSIKIPAPMQYAKKLCQFSSITAIENVNEDIKNKLYFI